jgi:hypothetical protein
MREQAIEKVQPAKDRQHPHGLKPTSKAAHNQRCFFLLRLTHSMRYGTIALYMGSSGGIRGMPTYWR